MGREKGCSTMDPRNSESRREFIKCLGVAGMALSLSPLGRAQQTQPAKKEIPHVPFGKTGLQVPVVVFGAMGINESGTNVLRAGIESGLVMIDTAYSYMRGGSERAVGEAIKGVERDKVMLHTKASDFPIRELDSMSEEEAYTALRKCVDESLSRLGGDYIDTYVCPHAASDTEVLTSPKLRAAAEKLKEEGKIRAFGVSSHSNYVACCMAAINSGWHDFIMPSLAITNLDPDLMASSSQEESSTEAYEQAARTRGGGGRGGGRNMAEDMREVLQAAQDKGVAVLAMKSLRYVPGDMMARVREKYAPEGSEWTDQQICYRALMTQPGVSTVTIGIQSFNHLEQALALPGIDLKA